MIVRVAKRVGGSERWSQASAYEDYSQDLGQDLGQDND